MHKKLTCGMTKILILLVIIICSCSNYEGHKDSLEYDSIKIIFSGSSEGYSTKEKIVVFINDSSDVKNLNKLKNESRSILTFFGAGTKGLVYNIDLIYTNSKTGEKLLINILKDYEMKPVIVYGTGTIFDGSYRNEELVEYLSSIIKLDAIKKYGGDLTQKEYEEFILKETN